MKKKRLVIYFCICLALLTLLGVSFFYLRKLNALEQNNERVDHSYQVIIQTNLLEQNLLNAETSQRGYLLSGNPGFLETYLSDLKGIPGILLSLDRLTADNVLQQRSLDTLRSVINKQVNLLKKDMAGSGTDSISVNSFHESSLHMKMIRELIDRIKNNEESLLSERNVDKRKNSSASRRSSYLSLLIAFIVCCIASVSIIWFFNRNEKYRMELEDKLEKLTMMNAEIRELAIASAHNLQEPMRKVQMIIDWLQHQGISDPRLEEQFLRIKDIYNRQQITNNKIIDYYDVLLNEEERVPIDLNGLIRRLQVKYNWAGMFELKVDLLPTITANPEQVELLFTDLVNNSIQFRDAGRALVVTIHAITGERPSGNGKNYHCIAVSDNGIGISETYFTKMFNLFQKLETSRDHVPQSGMGLSFCKRILLNHGGHISARRHSPHGLSILLFFPK
jgi:CHASE3 domain sensor protein